MFRLYLCSIAKLKHIEDENTRHDFIMCDLEGDYYAIKELGIRIIVCISAFPLYSSPIVTFTTN